MGNVRVLPVFEHRMLLYSFQSPPRLDLKLGVKGPAIGKMDIPQFDFVKRTVQLAISVGIHCTLLIVVPGIFRLSLLFVKVFSVKVCVVQPELQCLM